MEDLARPAALRPDPALDATARSSASPIAASDAVSPSSRIGRYVILRKLGEGGMGVVYAAYDEELDRKVAVKLLRDATPTSPERRLRILREAQAMARVSHPNVVSVYEVGEMHGRVFIAMEFVEGTTLTAWQEERRPWADILRVYLAAAEGLQAAHQAGLVHRGVIQLRAATEYAVNLRENNCFVTGSTRGAARHGPFAQRRTRRCQRTIAGGALRDRRTAHQAGRASWASPRVLLAQP